MRDALQSIAEAAFTETSIRKALLIAQQYGSMCWAVNIGIYDNPALERDLIAKATEEISVDLVDGKSKKDTLHIISEPYLTGGHTRLMEKLASMHECRPDLLITRDTSSDVIDAISKFFYQVHHVDRFDVVDQIQQMVSVIASYKRVILHIHPDDIFAVIACGLVREHGETLVYFVNHADHGFSFGSSVADVYFELSSYGRRLDGHKSISGDKSFLGIPISLSKSEIISSKQNASTEKIVFLSAGSDIKFKPRKGGDIRPLITGLLNAYKDSIFVVIGPNLLTNVWWWKVKLRSWKRLKILRHMPFEQYLEVACRADYYVDSHPFPGGTAFAEQLLSGQKCIGLESPFQGYSPAEKTKCASVEDVIEKVADYRVAPSVFEQVLKVNGYHQVKERYLKCLYEDERLPNLIDQYCDWTGDAGFMRIDDAGRTADVPVAAYLSLKNQQPEIARKVFKCLSSAKKIKLGVKIGVFLAKKWLRRARQVLASGQS